MGGGIAELQWYKMGNEFPCGCDLLHEAEQGCGSMCRNRFHKSKGYPRLETVGSLVLQQGMSKHFPMPEMFLHTAFPDDPIYDSGLLALRLNLFLACGRVKVGGQQPA